jgi:hypothetical protein
MFISILPLSIAGFLATFYCAWRLLFLRPNKKPLGGRRSDCLLAGITISAGLLCFVFFEIGIGLMLWRKGPPWGWSASDIGDLSLVFIIFSPLCLMSGATVLGGAMVAMPQPWNGRARILPADRWRYLIGILTLGFALLIYFILMANWRMSLGY